MGKEDPKVSACALAAAYMAVTGGDTNYDGNRLLKSFPILGASDHCPECNGYKDVPVSNIIMHLNDQHKWSREKTADWVAGLEKKLDMAPECQIGSAEKILESAWNKGETTKAGDKQLVEVKNK